VPAVTTCQQQQQLMRRRLNGHLRVIGPHRRTGGAVLRSDWLRSLLLLVQVTNATPLLIVHRAALPLNIAPDDALSASQLDYLYR